jgi:DNA-binding response OmpR family regulator
VPDVSTASSVAEGLRLGEEHDWLVLDIELGDGSGVELAERLLARRRGRHIVFLTGCTDWSTLSRAAELGSVLRKPTGIRELLRALEIPAALPVVSE